MNPVLPYLKRLRAIVPSCEPEEASDIFVTIVRRLCGIIPREFGLAILRFRLYDIDLLINRTLVYSTLTVLLALVYVGLVIGFQSLVHLFTGQVSQSPVVIVASTLAIAALFQPLLFSHSSTGWKIVRRWRLGNKIDKIVGRKYKYRLI